MAHDHYPLTLTIAEALKELRAKKISARELTKACAERIKERDATVHAYLEVFDDALLQADEADKRRAAGEEGKLLGIPLAIKDNILIEGRKVSAASKILEGYVAGYDATAVTRLRAEGAVFLGRTNMDEFAMGSSTESSAFGTTRNPHDEERVAGGSSGGSAAAIAEGGALGAFGSDTGGSVRQPASFCGVVGLKPTYGTISRYGLIAMGSSLDSIGPMGKTVADVELLFDAVRGHDPRDSTSLPETRGAAPRKPRVIGVPRHFMSEGLSPEVRENFDAVLAELTSKGYEVVDIELPNIRFGLPAYYIIMPAEASTNLARFDGVRYGLHRDGANLLEDYMKSRGEGFGREVRRRIILGSFVLSAGYYDSFYGKATELRTLLVSDFEKAFERVDVIATPTTPSPAFRVGEKGDPLSMYLEDIFTVTANLTGLPAISIPSGFAEEGDKKLPLGIQFTAPHLEESRLFHIGKAVLGA